MASKEYSCTLRTVRNLFFGGGRWELMDDSLRIRIDLTSMPSRTNALLYAIDQYPGANSDIEQNELRVHDDDGNVFQTIYATAKQLRLHEAGYPASVADGTAPKSLEGYSDEQLLAELRRRLAERLARTEDPPQASDLAL